MSGLRITITAAGYEAIVNAENNGTAPVLVTAVGLTATAFTPNPGMLALPGEIKRLMTISGGITAPDTIHVTIRDIGSDTYAVRGVGLYLDDGTLFAVYGQADVLAEKSAQAALLLAVDVQFADINATSLSFGDTNFSLNMATTSISGLVRLSTTAEARGGQGSSVITAEALRLARYAPGQLVVTAGRVAPAGTLACNGAAVLRSQYPMLFDAIGTAYGDGNGTTTFNLPNVKEGTVIVHTNDPAKVGEYAAGQNIAHTHGASAAVVGDHTHYTAVGAGGAHGHGASTGAVGDHVHSAWTDEQGWHGHTGATYAAGEHQHRFGSSIRRYASGTAYSTWEEANNETHATSIAGSHAHSLATDGAGTHAHNVGVVPTGGHSHTVSVAAAGDHEHTVDHRGAGAHSHEITVSTSGSTDNLPAGLRMMYCIAF